MSIALAGARALDLPHNTIRRSNQLSYILRAYGLNHRQPLSNQSKNVQNHQKRVKARENAGGQVTTYFRFASDWFRGWREFCRPITDRATVIDLEYSCKFLNQIDNKAKTTT